MVRSLNLVISIIQDGFQKISWERAYVLGQSFGHEWDTAVIYVDCILSWTEYFPVVKHQGKQKKKEKNT